MMPARRSVERTQSTRSGGFPRLNAVPPPTGVTARPRSAAVARASAVSFALAGTTNSEATTPSMETDRTSDFASGNDLPTSDSLQGMDAELLSHRLHAQRAHLSAHIALREDLLRVEHPGGIEAVLETGHCRKIIRGVDQGHVPALLGPDTVLTRERAADVDAVGDDLFARLEHALGRAIDAPIEEHQRVQIPVASVKDVGDR